MAIAFEQIVNSVMELPFDQQEMLKELITKRHIEAQRVEMAHDAQESLAQFHAGQLKPQSAQAVIAELEQSLNDEE